jgi:hypothetical protein
MILFILALFISNAFASNGGWMKAGGATAYWEKAVCEAQEGVECFDVKACPLDECDLKDVDDLSRPKFLEAQVVECSGREACQEALSAQVCLGGQAYIDEAISKVYCAVPNGFHTKKDLVVEPSKRAAKLAARAAEVSEVTAKGTKRGQIRRDLRDCLQTMRGTPTAAEQRACVLVLLRSSLVEELRANDL